MDTNEDTKAPPAIWFHVQKVYEAMRAKSAVLDMDYAEVYSDGGIEPTPRLYEGFTSHLFQELGIAVPSYGPVLDLLRAMGCITQERRGGGPSPSIWRLWKKPTLEDFELAFKTMPQVKIAARKEVHEDQRIADLTKALGGIDVPKALVDLQNQINELRYDFEAHLGEDHASTVDMARDDSETP
jgi:hypothetical protein